MRETIANLERRFEVSEPHDPGPEKERDDQAGGEPHSRFPIWSTPTIAVVDPA